MKGLRPKLPLCLWGRALRGTEQDLFASVERAAEFWQECLHDSWHLCARRFCTQSVCRFHMFVIFPHFELTMFP